MANKESTFHITSGDPGKTAFGTGFVIHRDDRGVFLLTCRHVIKDVGGPDSARVAGEPVILVSVEPGGGCDPDMAVLLVKKKWNVSPLPLGAAGSEGRSVEIPGCRAYRENYYLLKPEKGTLGVSMEITAKGGMERVEAWSLVMEGGSVLDFGYSGSPVIDTNSNRVLGVASDIFGQGETGVAVSIRALESIWPDIPKTLLEAIHKPESVVPEPSDIDRSFHRTMARYLCDRDEQVRQFERFFETCRKGECANHPQFYFVHGDKGECHEELVERFRTYDLRICVNRESRGEDAVRPTLDVPFPLLKTREDVEDELVRGLFRAVFPGYKGKTGLEDFRKLDEIREYRVVPVVHDIPVNHWKPFFPELLRAYISNFWMGTSDFIDSPLFLVFFLFEYPRADKARIWKRLKVQKRRNRIKRELEVLVNGIPDTCRCLLLQELGPVDEYSVEAWCKHYVAGDQMFWRKKVEDFFKGVPKSMENVVNKLILEFLDTMKNDDFQRYAE